MKVHCMFEQSGTFKNEFRKLGYEAYDYDIANDFSETDYVIDLFDEIEKAYCYRDSIFDNIKKDDLILAFFPCIRFEEQIQLHFRGTAFQMKNYDDIEKLQLDMKMHKELHDLYEFVTMLTIVALRGGLRLVIENPYSSTHYLIKYWAIKPKVIDKNRHENGDYYEKPTQYFFVNFEPKENIIMDEPMIIHPKKRISYAKDEDGKTRKVQRSMISKDYARRFIKTYLI